MVSQGWALAYSRYSRDYFDEELAARANRRGVWRGTFMRPWLWRERGASIGYEGSTGASEPEPAATCCKVCTTGKACGNSSISKTKTCHKPKGCACDAQ
jgi:hypothetical protein